MASLRAACNGFPPATQDTFAWDATPAQPVYGWEWSIVNSEAASTRGLAMDLTLSRLLQIQPCVNGGQAPVGIFPGALMIDAAYSAIFENSLDLDIVAGSQEPCVHTLTQPVLAGGCSLALTMPRSGWWDGTANQADGAYLSAQFSVKGIAEPAGGAAFTATLVNYIQAAYT
jgi:hypothetical protein